LNWTWVRRENNKRNAKWTFRLSKLATTDTPISHNNRLLLPGYIIRSNSARFYPNVTTLRSGLCYRKSVCRLSVTFVRPTQGVEAFGNISSPLCTLARDVNKARGFEVKAKAENAKVNFSSKCQS